MKKPLSDGDRSRLGLAGIYERARSLPEHAWWVSLLVVAFLLRLRGLDFLLPYFEFSDEGDVARAALGILATGDLNPHFFWYGSFPIYLTAGLYGVVLAGLWIGQGTGGSLSDFISAFGIYDYHGLLFYLGRFTSVAFGLLTIYLTYLVGRRLFGKKEGGCAALFLAISPFHINFSQVFKVDISLLLWVLLTLHFSLNIYEEGRIKDYLWAGVSIGLALATKYNFFTLLPVLFAAGLREGWRGVFSRKLLFSGYIAALVFALTCPFALLDFSSFRQQLAVQMGVNQQYLIYFRTDPSQFIYSRLGYQVFILFPFFFGPLVYLASPFGLGGLWKKNKKLVMLFLSFPLTYFLFSGGVSRLVMPQYQLPYFPFVAILGAPAMFSLLKMSRRFRAGGMVLFVLSALFFLSDLFVPHFRGHLNVYREAGEWIDRELAKDRTAVTYFWVYHSTRKFQFREETTVETAATFTRDLLEERSPDYIIYSESSVFHESRFAGTFRSFWEAVDWIGRQGTYRLVKSFRPPRVWEWFAGKVYREMKDFQISVYEKSPPPPS